MRLKGVIPAIIVLFAVICPITPSARAEELFSGTYTQDDFTFDDEKGVLLEIEVPDGDYTAVVKTGGDTETNANIYINGGERVREYTLKEGKTQDNIQPVVPNDGKIEFQITGENPNVTEITVKQLEAREKAEKPTIYIAGDSTAQTNYASTYPRCGWGQMLGEFFTDGVIIENCAMGGESSKSFNNDGRLDAILTKMCPGDYVFIQFGINDAAEDKPERYISAEDYRKLIEEKYVGEVEKRGGIPVLMTPSAPADWDEQNKEFKESRQEYADSARELAKELGCKFIDINRITTDTWNSMDKDEVLSGYFICEPLESGEYPAGAEDINHMKDSGAAAVAGLIAGAIPECVPELKQYLKGEEAFTDISGHWAEETILFLAKNNIVHGTGKGRFAPDDSVTRAEFLKMAMDAVGIPGHAYRDGECLEVKESDWYFDCVQSALDKGLLHPYMIEGGSTFHREIRTFPASDVETDVYVYDADKITDEDGNVIEKEQKFNGDKPITREEMASIVMSCVNYKQRYSTQKTQIVNGDAFTDENEVDAHYIKAVKEAHEHEYISGTDEGKFLPKALLTRAEAAVVISCLIKSENPTETENPKATAEPTETVNPKATAEPTETENPEPTAEPIKTE